MVNPHFDREETITEDIGFRGPHFDESIKERFSFGPPGLAKQSWSPGGEYGQHGEFEGWRSAEDPPSYRSDWQDYPTDEFTGIQSNVPSGGGFLRNIFEKFGGNLGRLGGGLETPYGGGNRNRFNPEPGPWNEFNPSDFPGFDDEVTSEDLLAKIYTSDMPGMQDPGTNLGFFFK